LRCIPHHCGVRKVRLILRDLRRLAVKVYVRIREGEKERTQVFEGVVISKRKGTTNASFTVRKVSYGIGVERVFPLHSPSVSKVEVVTHGRVRRSKIYYLRNLRGKAARIKERRRD